MTTEEGHAAGQPIESGRLRSLVAAAVEQAIAEVADEVKAEAKALAEKWARDRYRTAHAIRRAAQADRITIHAAENLVSVQRRKGSK